MSQTLEHAYNPMHREKAERFRNSINEFNESVQAIPKFFMEQEKKKKADQAFEALTGIKGEGLSDEFRQKILQSYLEGKKQQQQFKYDLEKQKELKRLERENEEYKQKNAPSKPKSPTELKEEENERVHQTGQEAFDSMVSLLNKGNLGLGSDISSIFSNATREDIGEFTSLTGALEAVLVDMVSRGTLSNTRFNYIKNDLLPKSSDSDAKIKGKLKGLAKILKFDDSSLTGKSSKKSEKTIEMMDAEGNTYDIPENLREKAKAKGLLG